MSREFSGSSQQAVYAIPASGGTNPNGVAWSALCVMRLLVVANNTWQSIMEVETSGASIEAGFGRQAGSGGIGDWFQANAAWDINFTLSSTENWMIYGVTKTAGTTAARGHKCLLGSVSNTHTASGSSRPDPASVASGNLRLAGNDDFANVRIAAAAFWVGTALADTDFNNIASAKTTASIAALSPTWLVDDADDMVNDLIGVQDKTSDNGSHNADNPASWVFGLGGAPATSFVNALSDRRRRRYIRERSI